ncbi:phosphoglycerate kinase [Haloferula sargassicola]|uniref:Phosphoglycerate kinase n=1 Tax=Haloferula sargassicola TaxID=490096 RepID=A0ABP9UPQ5_9BACT
MAKLSIQNLDVKGKEVLMRVDFNVPLKDGAITDDTRIQAAVPSIKHLLDGGAKLVLCSHLGRPKGEPKPEFSLKPAATRLGELLGKTVAIAPDCVGEETAALRAGLGQGEVLLLENTRYHNAEEKNEADFAKELAGSAEIYVNDAFGTAHRAHASTEGVTHYVSQSAMGFLMARELEYLVDQLKSPERPFLVIMGGAKVSGKIDVINNLMDKADAFLIGGAMAYTFLKAQGYEVGDSLVENDKLDLALDILENAKKHNVRFVLPVDTLMTQEFKEGAETKTTGIFGEGGEIPAGWEGIDIGEKSIELFAGEVAKAKTIVWNGPMGVFEIDTFAKGTKAIAEAVAKVDAVTIVGGGDSVTAVNQFGVADQVTFISTGGGASLELLEGKELPGVAALDEA